VIRDERGVAVIETLVTFPVHLFVYLGLYMFVYMLAGHLVVLRAADAAARAAIVFLPDSQVYYMHGEPARESYVRAAAAVALLPSPFLQLQAVTWTPASGFDPLRAEVQASFDCAPFLASFMCGLDRKVAMRAEATLPYQEGFPDR